MSKGPQEPADLQPNIVIAQLQRELEIVLPLMANCVLSACTCVSLFNPAVYLAERGGQSAALRNSRRGEKLEGRGRHEGGGGRQAHGR